MLTWLLRLFRRSQPNDPNEQIDTITDTARELRGSMLEETKASRHAQFEMRTNPQSHWYEAELLDRPQKAGRQDHA